MPTLPPDALPAALPAPPPLPEVDAAHFTARFADIRAQARPVVVRGLVAHWPIVEAAVRGDSATAFLRGFAPARPIAAAVADPREGGRFFYTGDVTRLNFTAMAGSFAAFLDDLDRAAADPAPPALAIQSEYIDTLLPGFVDRHRLDLVPGVRARLWLGNRVQVAAHFDQKENIACCVAGRRRFTLFAPAQIANLYPGPLEFTPAGTPISMVDFAAPDLDAHPRFAAAWAAAQVAELAPGDAIYIPYLWWHAVASLDAVSALVNYWWTDGPDDVAPPYPALFHAMAAFKWLPPEQRQQWRALFDHYVFEMNGDPGAHLPPAAQGLLAPPSPSLAARFQAKLKDHFR